MGTRPSAVATLVERTGRYTAVVALPDGNRAEPPAPISVFTAMPVIRDVLRSR